MYSDKVSFIANSDLFIRLNKASNMGHIIWLAHKIFYSIEGMVNIPFPAGVRTGVVYVYASYVVQMALNLIIFLFYRYRFIIKLKA